jgi:hypothetical protein
MSVDNPHINAHPGPSKTIDELPARELLSHVQQELTVLVADVDSEPSDFVKEARFFVRHTILHQLFGGLAPAQVRQRRWIVSFVEKLKQWNLERRSQPLKSFE